LADDYKATLFFLFRFQFRTPKICDHRKRRLGEAVELEDRYFMRNLLLVFQDGYQNNINMDVPNSLGYY